jgi:GTP-binding protein HflX
VGVLIDRKGEVRHVIIGDDEGIVIPDLSDYSLGRGKLRQLRCVHTHLRGEGLSEDDIADLTLLRLDAMAALTVDGEGRPETVHLAHLLPQNPEGETYKVQKPESFFGLRLDFGAFITALGDEITSKQEKTKQVKGADRGILVHVSLMPKAEIEERLEELKELCRTAGVEVADIVVQKPRQANPRFLLGEGKIREVIASALQKGVDLLIFDQELTPAQARAISELTDVRVIDRTQLILDIFAKRAHTPDGKIQVELAQLRYILPRLAGKGISMSRLMGGVGGRGPGESKLELDRRKVRDKISQLEKRLEGFSKGRVERRKKRTRAGVPIVSIVGYTNAGKSTLLNALTASDVFTEDLLFATLDTSTRRLRFPKEREVIITDTVGFLRDLPKGLVGAFKATLEELDDANLLLHVVDISNPAYEKQISSVEGLLGELGLGQKPVILVFNKADRLPPELAAELGRKENAVVMSARDRSTFAPLLNEMERRFWQEAEGLANVPASEEVH